MPYLITAVVLVGAIGVLNLLLTLGVLRRLREHSTRLAAGPAGSGPGIIETGQRPGDFAATDTDGKPVRRADLTGSVLVAFFSPDCAACVEALPQFLVEAAEFPGGRSQVLTVVGADGPETTEMATRLAEVSRVVVDGAGGRVAGAFQVAAFPAWCLLDPSGDVRHSGSGWTGLPTLTAA
ncbi:TlpA disulfide reductase family protein [Plantactinospora sp. GCM10030261]|uniref:TlpA disulfide reductase family protein n=1 Tax=Plantactinospora sp. GCM10030261 TaxID=3273420 RepID=UPI00360F4537